MKNPIEPVVRKYGLHIFSLLICFTGLAQELKRYSFTHYGMSQGIASNEVVCVTQDKEGYIWVGTTNGLQRFDGTRFRNFQHQENNPRTIPANYVGEMVFDKNDNFWIQTGGDRVGLFDRKKFVYTDVPLRTSNELYKRSEKRIRTDEEGNVMVVIGNLELLTYNKRTNEFSSRYNFLPIGHEWHIVDVLQIPGTRKYVIGNQKGLAIYNRATNNLSYKGHNIEKEPLVDSLGDKTGTVNLYMDRKGRLWFDTWEDAAPAIYAFDMKSNKIFLNKGRVNDIARAYHEARGFLEQRDGTFWLNGLNIFCRFIEKEKRFEGVYNKYENEQSISYNRVNDTWEDTEGNIWVATNNNGLFRFNPAAQFFTNIRHINRVSKLPGGGSFMSFARMNDGTVLAGSWGDGLYRLDKDFKFIPVDIKGYNETTRNPSAWCMVHSHDSNIIWVGAQPGIHRINQKTRSVEIFDPPLMQSRTVRQVAEDRFGNLWIGMQSTGVYKWNKEKGKRKFDDGIEKFSSIPPVQILKITVCKQGYIWIGTSSIGLYVIDPATDKIIRHYGVRETDERRLPVDGVGSVFQYDDTTMILGTSDLHFINTRTGKITRNIPLPDKIPGSIAAIEKDKLGYVWVSMTSGIFRLNPKNEIFIHFDRIDGIDNDFFIIAASLKLPDGRLLFGADNQMVLFNPLDVRINDAAPDITITGFDLMNRSLPVDSLLKRDRIELTPEDNSISIEFSGLQYSSTYKIKYMLEGMDKEWKTADKSQRAIYSYLPPGSYTFMVRSEDAEGRSGKNVTKMVIKVLPPFWKTWWFLGLVIFAATAVLFWLDKLRMQKLRSMEGVRTRIATSLTEDMTSSLTNINISSELAKTKINTDTQRTREYINQISETSNRMVQSMYDMVWSIDPKNDTMIDTIDRMKNHAVEIENSYPISINFDINKQVEKLKLDMEIRYELLCIYKEAVNNAARHAEGRYIKVSLRYNKNKLVMMILDDGKGFSMDDAAMLGRGISEMRRRATAINSILYVESEINTGTVIKLEVPV